MRVMVTMEVTSCMNCPYRKQMGPADGVYYWDYCCHPTFSDTEDKRKRLQHNDSGDFYNGVASWCPFISLNVEKENVDDTVTLEAEMEPVAGTVEV